MAASPEGRQVPLRRTRIGYIFNFLVRPFWRNIDNGYRDPGRYIVADRRWIRPGEFTYTLDDRCLYKRNVTRDRD